MIVQDALHTNISLIFGGGGVLFELPNKFQVNRVGCWEARDERRGPHDPLLISDILLFNTPNTNKLSNTRLIRRFSIRED